MNSRLFYGAVMFCALVLLAGCASRLAGTPPARCAFPDSPTTAAPDFMCEQGVNGFPLTTLKAAAGGSQTEVKAVVADQIERWASEWAALWFVDADQASLAQLWLTDELTEQARVVRSRKSPTDVVWVLIGLPESKSQIKLRTQAVLAN